MELHKYYGRRSYQGTVAASGDDLDLYGMQHISLFIVPNTNIFTEILGIDKNATPSEIKKAYHKAALVSHPDKVAANEKAAAEIKFKAVTQAYDILRDDQKRHLYDAHGMAAFDGSRGPRGGAGPDINDIFTQMFGGMGEMPPGFGPRAGPPKRRKGRDEQHPYRVTLEDLYKGKTTKFASKKNVLCSHCNGSGGKEKSKQKQCTSCQGNGVKQGYRRIGPGIVAPETVTCSSCKGRGNLFNPKDRCKKCKGERVTEERKVLEVYVPRGGVEGEHIVCKGEGDQMPDQDPGDIIFTLVQEPHNTFRRSGVDLMADIEITLAEALCGFSRVVVKHLDGRGIHIQHPQPEARALEPGQIIKVDGEGMPYKRSDAKGDLFLAVKVKFPDYQWLVEKQVVEQLKEILPQPENAISAEVVDEVMYNEKASLEEFGTSQTGGGAEWEDEDDGHIHGNVHQAQCTQQ